MLPKRKLIFLPAVLIIINFIFAGCGGSNSMSGKTPVPTAGGMLIIEPQDGPLPYLSMVQRAKQQLDVNCYLLTDRELTGALIDAAKRGVKVRVIIAGNPYNMEKYVGSEEQQFSDTGVQVKWSPFEGRYTFDHAKYIVADPAQGGTAILGSSNMNYSGLGGGNREYDYRTENKDIVNALEEVFNSDWNNHSPTGSPGQSLVLSPGSGDQIASFIQKAEKRLYIESEEMGNASIILSAIKKKARAGVDVRVVLPSGLSPADRKNAGQLLNSGAKVVYLKAPYPHSKMIISDNEMFIGSQNFSESALNKNREAGVIIIGNPVDKAADIFWRDFSAGR